MLTKLSINYLVDNGQNQILKLKIFQSSVAKIVQVVEKSIRINTFNTTTTV